jgi:large repetitive protein
LLFELLEPRVLLSADLNPLSTTALTSSLVPSVLTSNQMSATIPTVNLSGTAQTTSLNGVVYPSTAGPVSNSPSQPINGSIDTPGQVNQYTFTLTSATSLYFDSLTNRSDLYWSLSGPRGAEVNNRAFASSDASGISGSPALQLLPGNYTLTVGANGGAATGSYGFRLLNLANATPMTPGVQVADTLAIGNETQDYQFSGTAGEKVFLDAQSGSNLYWRLLDQYDQVVGSPNYFSNEQVTLPSTGTYTLLLEGQIAASSASPYSFTVFPDVDTNAALSIGSTTSGTISQPGQLNNFNFTLTAETRLVFDSLTDDGNLNWTLNGPAGTVVNGRSFTGSDSGDFGGDSLLDLPAGNYTLTVAGNSADTTSYAFRLLNVAQATPISYGAAISGTLTDAGASGQTSGAPGTETLAYSFTGTRGDQIQLDVSQNTGGIYTRLFDPTGQQLSEGYLSNGSLQTLMLSGTYTLLVEGRIYNTAPESFGFTIAKPSTVSISPLTGTAMTLGSTVSNTFSAAGQVDDYVFTATGPEQLNFDPLTTSYLQSLNATWQLDGPQGTILSGQNFYYNQLINLPVAGTYRFQVTAGNTSSVIGEKYSFTLANLSSATSVAYGQKVSGSLNPGTATDLYSFTATAGDRVYFDTLSSSGSLNWELVSPYGQEVFDQGFGQVGTTTLTAGGTYTLLVGGAYYNGTSPSQFTFQLDDVANTTAALTLGTTVNGSLTQAGQTANYTFTLAANTQLYLDALAQYSGFNWTLTGPSGTEANQVGLDTSNNQVLSVPAGQYTLTISGSSDATGAFAFRLLNLSTGATTINYGDLVTATNTPPQGDGVFQFTAAAGDVAYFNTVTNSDGYLQWQVLDPYGRSIVPLQGFSPTGDVALPYAGVYTVLVQGAYYDPNSTASYTFRVSKVVNQTHALTAVDGPAQTGPISVPGEIGTALDFTGAETVSVSNSPAVDLRTTVTVEFWLNPDSYNTSNTWSAIVYKGDGTNGDNARTYTVWLNSSGYIYFSTQDASGEQDIQTAAGSVPLGQWTHVAAVMDRTNGTLAIYLNGVLAASGSVREDAAGGSDQPLSIANAVENGTQYPLYGSLDDLRIFSTALTATQIANNYKTALTGTEPNLALYLPMNEASGATTLTDASPHAAAVTVTSVNAGLPGVITGRFATPGQVQSYTFTLAAASQLVFDGLTNNSNITVTLTGPDELSVTRNLRNGDSADFGSGNPVIAAPAGQYTISVTDSSNETDTYAFRFIDLADAQPISLDSPVSGVLDNAGETQAFSFTVTAGERIYLNTLSFSQGIGSGYAYWRLIDPNGNQVFGPDVIGDVGATTLPYAGTYTLLLEGRTYISYSLTPPTYSFAVDPIADQNVNLTLGTNPSPGPIWTAGKFGDALQFTGAEDLAVPDSAALDLTDNVTMEAWVKVDSMPSTWAPLIYKGSATTGSGDGRTYSLWLNGNGSVYLGTSDGTGGSEDVQTAAGLVTPGQWVDIAGVIDRTDGVAHIYINGVDVADGTVSSTLAPVSNLPLLIGGTQEVNSSFSYFQGSIDDVRIWSVARTGAQIAAAMNAPLSGSQTGLALYLKLDEDAGTTAADSSGNGAVATFQQYNKQGVTGYIKSPGQQVHYSFTLPSATTVYFDSLTDNSNLFWTLTGPSGTVVSARSFTTSDANSNPFLALPAGSYELSVGGNGATTGDFNFRLLPISTATPLTPGTPVNVALNPGNAANAYSFTATAGEQVFFDGTNENGGNVYVHVLDPLGHDLFGAVGGTSLSGVGVQTLAVAGTYTVLVDSYVYYDPDGASLTLNVQPVVNKNATLTLGSVVNGSIDTAGQTANYTFTVASATLAFFDSLTDNGNFSWSLSGPDGAMISNRGFLSSDSYDFQGSNELDLGPGAYQLTVSATGDATGAFSFNLLNAAAATPLTLGTPVTSTVPAETTRLYSFTANQYDRVQFISSSVTGGDTSWRLLDPNGNELFGPASLTTSQGIVTMPITGTYILELESRIYTTTSTNYTISVSEIAQPAANGATTQNFDTAGGLPYVTDSYGSGAAAQVVAGGPTGSFLRLASTASQYQDNNASFSSTGAGRSAASRLISTSA